VVPDAPKPVPDPTSLQSCPRGPKPLWRPVLSISLRLCAGTRAPASAVQPRCTTTSGVASSRAKLTNEPGACGGGCRTRLCRCSARGGGPPGARVRRRRQRRRLERHEWAERRGRAGAAGGSAGPEARARWTRRHLVGLGGAVQAGVAGRQYGLTGQLGELAGWTLRARWVTLRARWVDAESSLGGR
jgi:hypothetical protein